MPERIIIRRKVRVTIDIGCHFSQLEPIRRRQHKGIQFGSANNKRRLASADFLQRGFERRLPAVTEFRDMPY